MHITTLDNLTKIFHIASEIKLDNPTIPLSKVLSSNLIHSAKMEDLPLLANNFKTQMYHALIKKCKEIRIILNFFRTTTLQRLHKRHQVTFISELNLTYWTFQKIISEQHL